MFESILIMSTDDTHSNVIEGEVFEIEETLNKTMSENNEVFYLVKWKGYDDSSENTWEPVKNLVCSFRNAFVFLTVFMLLTIKLLF